MTKQDLHGAQITCLLVDDRRLGSAQRMRSVVFPPQPNSRNPLVYETGVLPRADVNGVVNPARKDEVVERASPAFEPSEEAGAGGLKEFELNGATGLLLNDDRSRSNLAAADNVADFDFDDIAAAKLAVDRQIEHRSVAQSSLIIQPEPDRPDLLRLQHALGPNFSASVPWPKIFRAWIIFGMSVRPILTRSGRWLCLGGNHAQGREIGSVALNVASQERQACNCGMGADEKIG